VIVRLLTVLLALLLVGGAVQGLEEPGASADEIAQVDDAVVPAQTVGPVCRAPARAITLPPPPAAPGRHASLVIFRPPRTDVLA
jgi:hypothetical protein